MFTGSQVESILESLPVALVTTDQNRNIVGANHAALSLFGYDHDEIVGQKVECLIPHRYARGHPGRYQGFVGKPSTRAMGAGRDLWALKKDGTEFPVEVGLTLLRSRPPLYMASVLDLTMRKQTESLLKRQQELLESKLQEARANLEEQISEKSRLEERQRLGRELHDSLSQNLYGIGLGLRTSLAKLKKQEDPSEALKFSLNLTEASLVEMRALLFKLRPKSLDNVPLEDVLSSHSAAVSARTKIPIEFKLLGQAKAQVPFELKYALYRIATEALHNCLKHSKADRIEILLRYGRRFVDIELSDNGIGFDTKTMTSGHGMSIMNERAVAAGGHLEVVSQEGKTTVRASVPWRLDAIARFAPQR